MSDTTIMDANIDVRIEQAIRPTFPMDTIDVRRTVPGKVHILIVSKNFNGLTEKEKQEMVWQTLRTTLGPDSQAVSGVIPYSTDELYG